MSIDINNKIEEHHRLVKNTFDKYTDKAIEIANEIIKVYKKGGKVLVAGNGGSASDAQHIATELVNKLYKKSKALSAIALTSDSAVVTAWSNDEGYDFVFSRQIEAHGKTGDIFIGISTSGNSKNIINAVDKANEIGLITISLLGRDGGKLKGMCNHEIIVNGDHVARIQEVHEIIYHIILEIVEEEFLE